MNLLDATILALAAGAVVGGYRVGLITRAVSWVAMGVGVVIGVRLLPWVLDRVDTTNEARVLLITLGVVGGTAFALQAVGLLVGARIHLSLPETWRAADRGGGAAAGLVGVVVGVWLLVPALAQVDGWVALQARTSRIARAVADHLPPPPDTLETALSRFLNPARFPEVFSGLRPAPSVGPPPAEVPLAPELVARIERSVARVEGIACRRLQEGSAAAVAPGLYITNAHVVAGEDETELHTPDGRVVPATVVLFDPDRDLALLDAPALADRPPLELADGRVGDTGAVFGFPGGGPLELSPFEVAREVTAVGRDLYDTHDTRRRVYFLAAQLEPGDSGAAVVRTDGRLIGVAFAVAPDRSSVAYALTDEEVREVLAAPRQPADTGACLR